MRHLLLQVASTTVALLVPGRLIAGFGIGFVSAVIILYMSEVAPKRFRGAIVSGYQFCITIGLLLASVVDNGTKDRMDSGSYRIPMGLQWLFAAILGVGLFLLPESPRFYVKKGRKDDAAHALSILRGQPADSAYIADELKELIDNHDYEMRNMRAGWADCFTGGWKKPSSNLRRVMLGMALQMMQQWTGVNFSMYLASAH
jgi:MFS family permease